MRPLNMNYATRPFRNNTLLWIVSVVLLLGLFLFSGWNIQHWWRYRDRLQMLQTDVSELDARNSEYQLRRTKSSQAIKHIDVKALVIQAEKANDVIGWKSFSWTQLFNHLEDRQPFDVRMSSIRPQFYAEQASRQRSTSDMSTAEDSGSVKVRLDGVARTQTDFISLQRSLICGTHFDEVEPIREVRAPRGEILFELAVLYYPNGTSHQVVCPPSVTDQPSTIWEWKLAEEKG